MFTNCLNVSSNCLGFPAIPTEVRKVLDHVTYYILLLNVISNDVNAMSVMFYRNPSNSSKCSQMIRTTIEIEIGVVQKRGKCQSCRSWTMMQITLPLKESASIQPRTDLPKFGQPTPIPPPTNPNVYFRIKIEKHVCGRAPRYPRLASLVSECRGRSRARR